MTGGLLQADYFCLRGSGLIIPLCVWPHSLTDRPAQVLVF
uniref:Uncharacterized protein n=1 Tax=Arundo donax TaxID=35708 RepID=A0A0A9BA83_ARUDO